MEELSPLPTGEKGVKYPGKDGRLLYGTLHSQPDNPVIVMVHGFCGNRDENGLFSEFAVYLGRMKHSSFRFDTTGIGGSEGEFISSSLRKQAADLDSTIDFLAASSGNLKVGVVGFSLGAAVALLCNSPRISSYSFWSPAFFPAEDMYPRYDTPEIHSDLASQGYFEKKGLRVGRELFSDLGAFSAEEPLRKLQVPVQIVHGTEDLRIPIRSSFRARDMVPSDHEMVVVEGADHSFSNPGHRKHVFRRASEWFLRTIPLPVSGRPALRVVPNPRP